MEEKRNLFSYFGGVFRFVIFLIILIVVTFFIIRWIGNRQETRRAQEASQGTTPSEETSGSESSSQGLNEMSATDTSSSDTSPIPHGIADTTPSTGSGSVSVVPETGLATDVLMTTLMISASTYLVTKNLSYHRIVRMFSMGQ